MATNKKQGFYRLHLPDIPAFTTYRELNGKLIKKISGVLLSFVIRGANESLFFVVLSK